MDIIILCKTKTKDSLAKENTRWHKEYGVFTNLSTDEVNHYMESFYGMRELYQWDNPVITASRKVEIEGENITFGKWILYDGFENIQTASMGFGDSEYWFNGESLHPLHAQAVERNNKVNTLRSEYNELEKILKPEFRHGNFLKDKYNDLYEAELKNRRLYSKAKNGIAPQNVIGEITGRLKVEYEKELNGIKSRMEEIKIEIEGIK